MSAEDESSPLLANNPTGGFSTITDDEGKTTTPPETSSNDWAVTAPDAPAPVPVPTPAPIVAAPIAAPPVTRAETEMSWGVPAGLPLRPTNDENLQIFRRAVGINTTLSGAADIRSLEEGRRKAVGMYAATMAAQSSKQMLHVALTLLIYLSHFGQIIMGASLTALGPTAGEHTTTITILGAVNTVIAGVLALIKGQGLPERMRQDQAEFRKLQDWIEQTEALLAVGVIGRNRKEVGMLVQVAFKKYNAVKESEDNNVPENYIRVGDGVGEAGVRRGRGDSPDSHGDGK